MMKHQMLSMAFLLLHETIKADIAFGFTLLLWLRWHICMWCITRLINLDASISATKGEGGTWKDRLGHAGASHSTSRGSLSTPPLALYQHPSVWVQIFSLKIASYPRGIRLARVVWGCEIHYDNSGWKCCTGHKSFGLLFWQWVFWSQTWSSLSSRAKSPSSLRFLCRVIKPIRSLISS